jgi:hypothetical protein
VFADINPLIILLQDASLNQAFLEEELDMSEVRIIAKDLEANRFPLVFGVIDNGDNGIPIVDLALFSQVKTGFNQFVRLFFCPFFDQGHVIHAMGMVLVMTGKCSHDIRDFHDSSFGFLNEVSMTQLRESQGENEKNSLVVGFFFFTDNLPID